MHAARTFATNRGAGEAAQALPLGDPPVDLVHLARQTDGDEALEAELLALFERQAASFIQKLADPELARTARADVAHRLKGSALAIGAARVAGRAEALEIACLSSDARAIAPASRELALALAEARAAIADLRA